MKNTLKLALCLLLALVMVASVVACGDEAKETEAEKPGTEAPATEAPETKAPETEAPETKHIHDYTFKSEVTAPTCTEDGFTVQECECGQKKKVDKTTALGHDYDEGVVTKAPTDTEEGEKVYTCSRCGEKKTEVLNKIGVVWPKATFDDTHNSNASDIKDYIYSVAGVYITNANNTNLNTDTDGFHEGAVKRFRAFTEEGQLRFHGQGNTTITWKYNPNNNANYVANDATFDKNDAFFAVLFGENKQAKFTAEFDFGFWMDAPAHPDTRTDEQKAADALDPSIPPYDEFDYAKKLIDLETNFTYGPNMSRDVAEGDGVNMLGYDRATNTWTIFGNSTGCNVETNKSYHFAYTFDTNAKTITATVTDGKDVFEAGSTTYRDPVEGDYTAIWFGSMFMYIDNFQMVN